MKLVCGVGVNDADYAVTRHIKKRVVWLCPFYSVWSDMLKRCYSTGLQIKSPTYLGCSVDIEWRNFSVFRAWMLTQDWVGKELDKDILLPGNKVYSPQTCVFVSAMVNSFLNAYEGGRGEWPIGVSWMKARGKFTAHCRNPFTRSKDYLGLYTCPDQAHQAWKARKLEHALTLASQQTDDRIAMALVARYC